MIDVNRDKFAALEAALETCIRSAKDADGRILALADRRFESNEVANAAAIALMVLSGTWVKPENVKFIKLAA